MDYSRRMQTKALVKYRKGRRNMMKCAACEAVCLRPICCFQFERVEKESLRKSLEERKGSDFFLVSRCPQMFALLLLVVPFPTLAKNLHKADRIRRKWYWIYSLSLSYYGFSRSSEAASFCCFPRTRKFKF